MPHSFSIHSSQARVEEFLVTENPTAMSREPGWVTHQVVVPWPSPLPSGPFVSTLRLEPDANQTVWWRTRRPALSSVELAPEA